MGIAAAELCLLLAVFASLRSRLRASSHAARIASAEATEYRRARRDYRRLVRHRIANPLTTVRGAAQTLAARRGAISAAAEAALVQSIVEAAEELERVAVEPLVESAEELGLAPAPDLASRR